MKIFNSIILLTSLTLLTACASNRPQVTGTEGGAGIAQNAGSQADLRDSDGDSVINQDDACPDTASRVIVDVRGCEIALGPIAGLNFGPSAVSLPSTAQPILDKYVDAMIRNPELVVSIEGHTDNRGPAAANLELSKERVLSVVRYMVSSGISPDRIKPYGYGESRPRSANATAKGREQNRRIEIKVVEGLL